MLFFRSYLHLIRHYHFSPAIPTGLFSYPNLRKEIASQVKHDKLRLITEYRFNCILYIQTLTTNLVTIINYNFNYNSRLQIQFTLKEGYK